MKFELGFGNNPQQVDIPDNNIMAVLSQNEVSVKLFGTDEIERALSEPVKSLPLKELVKPTNTVVIVTSDCTRPVPSHKIIPSVLNELRAAGVPFDNIRVVFALGSHRKQTVEEHRKLVGDDVYDTVLCLDGDPADFLHMGTTRRGTPVDIVRTVAEADVRIGIGNIEYHYFAGYSGGAKAIMPGVSTREAIQANHSRMVSPAAVAGCLDNNPVREDIEEAISFCPLHFIVNVVLDENKEIIHAVAGDYIAAHREGCKFLDSLYLKHLPERADIVIASQGGHPKDINLYQTQKALDNARHAVKKGGVIILVGSCREGLGEKVFEEWMMNADSALSLIERIQKDFQLGGHKAAAIALVANEAEIFLVSEMESTLVTKLFMHPFVTVQEALNSAFDKMGADASVLVMPFAGSTLPVIDD